MGFRSFAPEAQQRLRDAIAERLPGGVRCDIGYPAGGLDADHVYIGAAFDVRVNLELSGGRVRGEEVDITARCIATRHTDDLADPQEAALELAGCVEDAVQATPTLAGLCDFAYVSGIETGENFQSESERQYLVVVIITCSGSVVAE